MPVKMIHCDDCGGSGRVDEIFRGTVDGGPIAREILCPTCAGEGKIIDLCGCCGDELQKHNTNGYCDECNREYGE
jgi:DnaJ-class molecular chaperone